MMIDCAVMKILRSFVRGAWLDGEGARATLVNPATEEPLAEAGAGGIDWAGALDHARTVGGAALRALSFGERREPLRALSRLVHPHRDELIELSLAHGRHTPSHA